MAKNHRPPSEAEAGELARFGVSIAARLLQRFDRLVAAKGYASRSEALRDLIRDRLVEAESDADEGTVIGALVLVYDHETRDLSDRMTHMQHHEGRVVISAMHVHLNDRDCLEVLALRGPGQAVRELADRLLSLKGVKHGKLVITGSGEGTPV